MKLEDLSMVESIVNEIKDVTINVKNIEKIIYTEDRKVGE